MSQVRQRIRFVRARDGVQIAWAESGSGPTLVKAANWMSHLEYEWESPVWRHWLDFFSGNFHFIRYDERGCGLTDRVPPDGTVEQWTDDLTTVIEAAKIEPPFALLGISQGSAACVAYAVQHPERVSKMVLYGGYARGYYHRGRPDAEREYRIIIEAMRVGWGKRTPEFRQLFTSRFLPDGTPEQLAWFNEVCRMTTTPDIAAALLDIRARVNVVDLLPHVSVPTLVIHSRDDHVIPLSEGRLLAAGIRDAQFVEVDSKNHVLLAHEPAWQRFQEAVLDFLGGSADRPGDPFASLSRREREILGLLTEGLSNAQIGDRLSISEKTVRNHVSNVFDKLGVWTRAQAMVFARDHGFRAGERASRPQ